MDDFAAMSLITYQQIRPWAAAIREAVLTRQMPPWKADPRYGKWSNDWSLSGIPKRSIASVMITPFGLAGDACAHPQIHGGPRQAVLLIAAECIDDLRARGYPVF